MTESQKWAELVNIFLKYGLKESDIASMVAESLEGFEHVLDYERHSHLYDDLAPIIHRYSR